MSKHGYCPLSFTYITNPSGGEREGERERSTKERHRKEKKLRESKELFLPGQPTIHILLSNVSHSSFSPHKIVGIPLIYHYPHCWRFSPENHPQKMAIFQLPCLSNVDISIVDKCLWISPLWVISPLYPILLGYYPNGDIMVIPMLSQY